MKLFFIKLYYISFMLVEKFRQEYLTTQERPREARNKRIKLMQITTKIEL